MVRNLIATLAALAATVFSASTSAQAYLGVGVGGAKTNNVSESSTTTAGVSFNVSRADENRSAWKFLAGYQFTPNWGMEAQVVQLGTRNATVAFGTPVNAQGTTNSGSATHSGIAGTGTLPLSQNFYLMGKLGVSFNSMDTLSVTVGGVTVASDSSRKTDVLAGVGGGYNFTKNIGFRLEFESLGKLSKTSNTWNNNVKSENLSLNLLYRF